MVIDDNNRNNRVIALTHFGDTHSAYHPDEYCARREQIFNDPLFASLKNQYSLDDFIFLHQQHTVMGHVADDSIIPFVTIGDYLVTNRRHIGLGIMTADCLPVIAIDPEHNAIGIAHAGWRGALGNIVLIMLEHMRQSYDTNLNKLKIIFGPSARGCCYQVDQSFITILGTHPSAMAALQQRADHWYFDLVTYVIMQLKGYGIDMIENTHAPCTICNKQWCSYRRDKEHAQRQVSIVALL